MEHPTPDKRAVLGLLAAADALPTHASYGGDETEQYARAVDTLDALAWLDPSKVDFYAGAGDGRSFEVITVGEVELSSPIGFTPVSDRAKQTREAHEAKAIELGYSSPLSPEETLASRCAPRDQDDAGEDSQASILLERIARNLTSGEEPQGSMNYAERMKAGVALSRLLRDVVRKNNVIEFPLRGLTDREGA